MSRVRVVRDQVRAEVREHLMHVKFPIDLLLLEALLHRKQCFELRCLLELAIFFIQIVEEVLLNDVGVSARLKPCCMEIYRLVGVVQQAEAGDGLGLRDVGVSEAQELQDYPRPVLLVVLICHFLELCLLLGLQGQTIGAVRTADPDIIVGDGLLEEVRSLWVVRLAEGNNLAHRHVVPIGERTDNVRDIARFYRLKPRHCFSNLIDSPFVVLDDFGVLDLG